jgi:hypothetical protein
MQEITGPKRAHAAPYKGGPQPGSGRIRKSRLLSTVKFRELCIKHGPRALEIIAEIAERGEPDLVRLAAAKFLIERGYGVADDAPGGPTQVTVITGVRDGNYDSDGRPVCGPSHRPTMPDGSNPFAEHGDKPPPPSGSRPMMRGPVAEPPSPVRLTDAVSATLAELGGCLRISLPLIIRREPPLPRPCM